MKYELVEDKKLVVVKGIYLDEGLKALKENNYIGLVYRMSYKEEYPENKPCNIENEIQKITKCKQIEELVVDVSHLIEGTICINDLSKLPNLKILWLTGGGYSNKYEVDFSLFPNLEEVELDWQKKGIDNFDKLINLKKARIEEYSEKNMLPFRNCTKLEKLTIRDVKLQNLEGIENCVSLKYLSIIMCGRLRSIKGIENLHNLEKLLLLNIRDIADISLINQLSKLNTLILERNKKQSDLAFLNSNSLVRLEIDYVDNFDFVKYQNQLKIIDVNKQVLNNDLSPLLLSNSLYLVLFKDKKTYNFTETEINDLIEQKEHYNENELNKIRRRTVFW